MIGNPSKRLNNALMLIGILLILIAVLLTSASFVSQRSSAKRAAELAVQLRMLIPSLSGGYPDGRENTAMPMLELDGENFIGILEIPHFGRTLPVCTLWERGKIEDFPCRYTGSVYDGSLIIGGSDYAGQLDFMKTITETDRIFFIDTEGMRYSYRVVGIEITDDVSSAHLTSLDADLVIFARNAYSLDYTVIKCSVS